MKTARLLLLAAITWPVMGLAEGDFVAHWQAAVTAYRSGDTAAFLASARRAQETRPDSPQAAYLLAAAEASSGERALSLARLQGLAAQGLQFEPQGEPAFADLDLATTEPVLLRQFAENGLPKGEAKTTWQLDLDRFVPEGIAWDAKRQRFLLGSIHQRRIVAVDADGQVREFAPAGSGGLLSVFGMAADEASGTLWVATAGMKESGPLAEGWLGRSGILAFDLASGQPRGAHWLPVDGREHVLGDVCLVPGGVLSTDSLTGEVLRLDPDSGVFTVLVETGKLVSPQGITLAADPGYAYVADYRGGLYRLDLADGGLEKLSEAGTSQHGIDGLYRHGDWLLAIQNGIRPQRVVALKLDPSGLSLQTYRILASALPSFDEPNLGAVAGGRFHFIANSHWPRFDAEGQLPDGLAGPLLLSVALPE